MGDNEPSAEDDHAAWEKRLGRMRPAVERWLQRTKEGSVPAPGSSLQRDDVPGLSVSNLAWYKIVAAVEHLGFFFDAAVATQTTYPTAQLTILRTALLAGSHATWLLAPPQRLERRTRAARLSYQELQKQIAMIESPWGLTEAQEIARQKERVRTISRREELVRLAEAFGASGKGVREYVTDTGIVKWAAQQVHAERDQEVASGVLLLWRMGSGAAHAYRSHALQRLDLSELETQPDGSRVARLRGDLATDIGPAAAAATLAVREAFRLWDLRRVGRTAAGGRRNLSSPTIAGTASGTA